MQLCPPKIPDDAQKQQLNTRGYLRQTLRVSGDGSVTKKHFVTDLSHRRVTLKIHRDFCINAYLTFQSHWKRIKLVTQLEFSRVFWQQEKRKVTSQVSY